MLWLLPIKSRGKVYTCTVLDNLSLYCQNATKCSLLFFGEENKNGTKCSVSFQSPRLCDIGRPHGWLWPRPTERMHSWDGHWQCTGWDAQPSAPSVSAHSSESRLKTTVSAVLCNWGFGCEVKGGLEGGIMDWWRGKTRGGCFRLNIETKLSTLTCPKLVYNQSLPTKCQHAGSILRGSFTPRLEGLYACDLKGTVHPIISEHIFTFTLVLFSNLSLQKYFCITARRVHLLMDEMLRSLAKWEEEESLFSIPEHQILLFCHVLCSTVGFQRAAGVYTSSLCQYGMIKAAANDTYFPKLQVPGGVEVRLCGGSNRRISPRLAELMSWDENVYIPPCRARASLLGIGPRLLLRSDTT